MSIVYNGSHSIEINGYNTWTDWHLVPASRPFIALPSPNINIVQIAGTSKFVDMTDYLPGGLTFGQRTGSWDFYIDHDKWGNWTVAYNTIADLLHGKPVTVRLVDDPTRQYSGRVTIAYTPDESHSRISFNYTLYPIFEHNDSPIVDPTDKGGSGGGDIYGNWTLVKEDTNVTVTDTKGTVYALYDDSGFYHIKVDNSDTIEMYEDSVPITLKVEVDKDGFCIAYVTDNTYQLGYKEAHYKSLSKGTNIITITKADISNNNTVYYALGYRTDPEQKYLLDPVELTYSIYKNNSGSSGGGGSSDDAPEKVIPSGFIYVTSGKSKPSNDISYTTNTKLCYVIPNSEYGQNVEEVNTISIYTYVDKDNYKLIMYKNESSTPDVYSIKKGNETSTFGVDDLSSIRILIGCYVDEYDAIESTNYSIYYKIIS